MSDTQFTRSPSGTMVHIVEPGLKQTVCGRTSSFWPKWSTKDTLGRTGADVRIQTVCSKCRA